jgi:hypothetical protein
MMRNALRLGRIYGRLLGMISRDRVLAFLATRAELGV